jgi:hypothetical protein
LGQGTAPTDGIGAVGEWPGGSGALVCGLIPAGAVRIAEAVSGFPQSMQKRDMASLSRPQNVQETSGVIAGKMPFVAALG